MKIENLNWYLRVIKNCMSFKERASRKEFFFVPMFITFAFGFLMYFTKIFLSDKVDDFVAWKIMVFSIMALTIIFIAVVVRRLHDINRSGWWSLIFLFPAINLYAFGFLLLVGGKSGLNQYGSSPEERVEQPPTLKTLFILFTLSSVVGLFSYFVYVGGLECDLSNQRMC